jgi:hypothetical protein
MRGPDFKNEKIRTGFASLADSCSNAADRCEVGE